MKIYFCGSIRAGRQDADLYARLIEQLRAYGTVLTEHVGSKELEECRFIVTILKLLLYPNTCIIVIKVVKLTV